MYEIHYKQIDPDTGRIIREERIATCDSMRHANWIKNVLNTNDDEPNREYSVIEPSKLSLDQIMREYKPFKDERPWDLTVIDEKGNDLIVMAPNGDTQYMTKDEYEQFKKRRKND
jgi:hypothetical protein